MVWGLTLKWFKKTSSFLLLLMIIMFEYITLVMWVGCYSMIQKEKFQHLNNFKAVDFSVYLTKPQAGSPPWFQSLFPCLAAPGCGKKNTFCNLLATKRVCLSGPNFGDLVEIFSDPRIMLREYLSSTILYMIHLMTELGTRGFHFSFYSLLIPSPTPILCTCQFDPRERSERAGDNLCLVSCLCTKQRQMKIKETCTC